MGNSPSIPSFSPYGKRVLYCGMADDIYTPLYIFPELEELFVMDLLDRAYSYTLELQRDTIVNILTNKTKYSDKCYLPHKAVIIEEIRKPKSYYLTFNYNGKIRKLSIFSIDYLLYEWPKQINNIDTLMHIGAPFQLTLRDIRKTNLSDMEKTYKNLTKMVKNRLNETILYIPGFMYELKNSFDVKTFECPCKTQDNVNYFEYTITPINDYLIASKEFRDLLNS